MRIFLIILILLNAIGTMACRCSLQPDFKNKDDLNQYDFVALVEVIDLAPRNIINTYMNQRINGDIKIGIKELFKGDTVSIVNDPAFTSDCALELHEGEQWLFFGTLYHGKMQVSSCTYSVRYRDTLGKREWNYFTGIKQVDLLRQLYAHTTITGYAKKVLYPSGKTEIEQSFKKGKLDGLRKIYYPSGRICIIEKFKNGNRAGYRNLYSPTGQLLRNVVYENGLIKKAINYHDSTEVVHTLMHRAKYPQFPYFKNLRDERAAKIVLDSLRKTIQWLHISYIKVFESNGRSYKAENYYYTGKLRWRGYTDWVNKISESDSFYEDGKLQIHTKYDQGNDKQVENDYKKDGSRKDFISKCVSCKLYFDAGLPEATPEKAYIQ